MLCSVSSSLSDNPSYRIHRPTIYRRQCVYRDGGFHRRLIIYLFFSLVSADRPVKSSIPVSHWTNTAFTTKTLSYISRLQPFSTTSLSLLFCSVKIFLIFQSKASINCQRSTLDSWEAFSISMNFLIFPLFYPFTRYIGSDAYFTKGLVTLENGNSVSNRSLAAGNKSFDTSVRPPGLRFCSRKIVFGENPMRIKI